jgi:hypothetical protein
MTMNHGGAMSANDKGSDAAAGRDALRNQLRQLEEFVAQSAAGGEVLPPAALEMVERLREIVNALDALTASLDVE